MLVVCQRNRLKVGLFAFCCITVAACAFNFGLHPHLEEWRQKGLVVSEVKTTKKVVAFTFDDGPNPSATPQILEILNKNHAKATFFVVGVHVERYPKIVQQIAKQGHEIGNHGYSHKIKNYKQIEFAKSDIRHNEELLASIAGKRPVLLRPPGGFLSDALVDYTQKEKIQIVTWTWNMDFKDWKTNNSTYLANGIINNVRPGQIIILHDGGNNRGPMIKALSLALPELTKKGYRCVTVSELLALQNQ